MVRLEFSITLQYQIPNHPCDFIFNIQAAQTHHQIVSMENLQINQTIPISFFTETLVNNRFLRLCAMPGNLSVQYDATVDITHHIEPPANIHEIPIVELPHEALIYLYPSRYCQSDQLRQLANELFGQLAQGYWRVRAIQEYVQTHIQFLSGSTQATTSALDTLNQKVGVCRDFAHLMIALCRASNIPARFVTGIDYGADPVFGPTDFHAYVETFLSGRWYLFDPTGMTLPTGLIRIGTGRDAADVSFATIFGTVNSTPPLIHILSLADLANGVVLPYACVDGLSTANLVTETHHQDHAHS